MSSSRKRARSGTSKEDEIKNDRSSAGVSIGTNDSSSTPSALDEGTENATNPQSPSSAHESPQSFLTQEEMNVDHSEEASKRALYFAPANDDPPDEDDGNHDLHADSDESSYSSGASSSEDEEDEILGMTLMEKRQRNQERNALRHQQLFREYNAAMGNSEKDTKETKKNGKYESDDDENDSKPRARGMLMKGKTRSLPQTKTFRERVKELEVQYPHREPQIRQLLSLFQSTIAQVSPNQQGKSSGFVPSPLFVIGSNGTGKTSVVRDTLQLAREDSATLSSNSINTQVLHRSEVAYINCATLEPATIGRLVVSISNQLRPKSHHSSKRSSKRKHRKRKRDQSQGKDIAAVTVPPINVEEGGEESSAASRQHAVSGAAAVNNDNTKIQEQLRRVQPTRAAKVVDMDDPSKQTRRKGNSKDPDNDDEGQTTDRIETPHSAVVALGRNLQLYYGNRGSTRRCGFVILDQGPERLLTMSSSDGRNEKSNVLAELLLLPRVLQLNICFIVVTTNRLLPSSRLNNLAGPNKASATLSTALRPMCIQFPAYKGKECFMILKSRRAQDTITGSYRYSKGVSCKSGFFSKLLDSFLTSLIQFLSDYTRDINDYFQVGRSLWPVFIRPIDPKNIQGTMKAISSKTAMPPNAADHIIETRILAHLGQKLLRFTSSEDPTGIMLDLSSHKKPCKQSELELPFLQLCLLLAAFICQSNRTDQDTKFFASRGNGKRRKNNKAQQGENLAYSASATEVKQLQSLRPKPFQLERVLSIFVTLVRLNPREAGIFADMDEERIQALGSTRLDMDLKQLVDLGFLHPASTGAAGKHNATENLDRARFWCSLTRAEADRIATRAKIPLDSYML